MHRAARRVTPFARRTGAGFTLIELLVVLVIVGLGAGLVALSLGSDERRTTEREAKRLAGALEHAAATAQWRAETRRGTDDRWEAILTDDILSPRTLPAGITVTSAAYAGAPVAPDAILPFRPSGRNEPFTLVVGSSTWFLEIAADPLNRVHLAVTADSR